MENEEEKQPEAGEKKEKSLIQSASLLILDLVKLAILAGITIGLVRYFLFKPFYVSGQSMEPNFLEKDYLIIDEITYRFHEPQRGEVVVFKSPLNNGDYYLKRIVGLPGERVKIDDDKVVIFNSDHPQGMLIDETYLTEKTQGSLTLVLNSDEYFVLGDNRNASFDSRRFGPIKRSSIVGRVWVRGWPINRINKFADPVYNF